MDNRTFNMIGRFTNTFIVIFNINVPADLNRLIEELGGTVLQADVKEAVSMKTGEHSFTIEIDYRLNSVEQRFYVARELGNLLLNHGYMIMQEDWDSLCDNEILDHKRLDIANEFAVGVLLPMDAFKEELSRNTDLEGNIDMGTVARKFDVTEALATERARKAGLAEYSLLIPKDF